MKKIGILDLLHLAFVHELAKGGGADGIDSALSAWRLLGGLAELGVMIDLDRIKDGGPVMLDQGDPHPDAVTVGHAVRAVADLSIDLPAQSAILADWPDYERNLALGYIRQAYALHERRTQAEKGRSLMAMIVSSAVMRKIPGFDAPVPKVRMDGKHGCPAWFVKKTRVDSFGKSHDVEIDGFNYRSRRPYAGAYRKYVLSQSPLSDILGRIDYHLWIATIRYSHGQIVDNIDEHILLPFEFEYMPWIKNIN